MTVPRWRSGRLPKRSTWWGPPPLRSATTRIRLEVTVERGARLALRSAASTIAWASTGSSLFIEVRVEEGGALDWHLQPLVASRACNFSQRARLSLAAGGRLRWVEEVVLGRHGEGPGRLDLRLDVDVDGAPCSVTSSRWAPEPLAGTAPPFSARGGLWAWCSSPARARSSGRRRRRPARAGRSCPWPVPGPSCRRWPRT